VRELPRGPSPSSSPTSRGREAGRELSLDDAVAYGLGP